MSSLVVYKIRRKSDGKFSTGGTTPSFSKNGKTWNTIGHLKSHLTGVADQGRWIEPALREQRKKQNIAKFYSDCEIVEYERVEAETQTIQDFMQL